jgi:putative ABC transport system permease protein
VAVSWRIVGIIGLAGLASAVICGLVPAVHASRWSVADVLRRGATPARREIRLRRVCVIAEVALAFVLLVSMALVGRTLFTVLKVNPGFNPGGVLTLQVSLPTANYSSDERLVSFYYIAQVGARRSLRPRYGVDCR